MASSILKDLVTNCGIDRNGIACLRKGKRRSLIRNLTRHDVNNHAPICQLKEEYKFITDPLDIAECLNLWFVKQLHELLRNLPLHSLSRAPLKHIKVLTADSINKPQFTIPHTTPKNIEELLTLEPSHKTARSDGLGARLLNIATSGMLRHGSSLICIKSEKQ